MSTGSSGHVLRRVFMGVLVFDAILCLVPGSAAIPFIAGDLSASMDEVAKVQSAGVIGFVLGLLLAVGLSRFVFIRWSCCAAAAGFATSSLLCASVTSAPLRLVARSLQGLFGGAMLICAASEALSRSGGGGVLFSVVGAAIVLTAALSGPIVNGLVAEIYGWRWLPAGQALPAALVALTMPALSRLRGLR